MQQQEYRGCEHTCIQRLGGRNMTCKSSACRGTAETHSTLSGLAPTCALLAAPRCTPGLHAFTLTPFLAWNAIPPFLCFTNFCLLQEKLDNRSTVSVILDFHICHFFLDVYLSLIIYPNVGCGHNSLGSPTGKGVQCILNGTQHLP